MMSGLRYPLSALAGTGVAILMLWMMQLLVTSPSQKLPTTEANRLIDFVRLKREENVQLKERLPPPPLEKTAPPPRPRLEPAGHTTTGTAATGHGHEPGYSVELWQGSLSRTGG